MRAYLTPARKYFSRVMPDSASFKLYMSRKKHFVFLIVAASITAVSVGFVTVKALGAVNAVDEAPAVTTTKSSTDTAATVEPTPAVSAEAPADTSTQVVTGPSSSSSTTQTTVTVNNQPVAVPQNGTVQKTITNGDGTATNVSISTNSSGSTSTNSYSSTNISSNTHSSTRSSTMNTR